MFLNELLSGVTGAVATGGSIGLCGAIILRSLQTRQRRQARLQILFEEATERLLVKTYGSPTPTGRDRVLAVMSLLGRYGYPFSRADEYEIFTLYNTHPPTTKKRVGRQRAAVEALREAARRIEEDVEVGGASITLADLAHNARSVPVLVAMSSALSVLFNKLGPPPEGMTAYSDPQLRGGGGSAR